MKNEKDFKNNKVSKPIVWDKPSIKKLGNAKDLVANINVAGGGDTQFSLLLPS